MKQKTYEQLFKALQKIEKKLVKAYVTDVRGQPRLQAHMQARHKAAEIGGRLDDFIKLCAQRSAVQLLLRTVYVRVLEDLGALEPERIRGQWSFDAFRQVAPALGVRSYLKWVFRDLAHDFPALFTPGPDELPLPGEDLCREIWDLWHKQDGRGNLLYDWKTEDGADFDSRFLGDLYQDLDADVRKRYALLQTPEFVESYILDHTMTPALEEFDPVELRENGDAFRVLDPTCGSGHFLVGAFHRMADFWEEKGFGKWDAAARALESVWGIDINAHAVDIAAFRLLLEVRARTGVVDLDKLATLTLNLRVMDSLIPWERGRTELFPAIDRLSRYATPDEREANAAFLEHDFHVVVGNPPYITPKDSQKRKDYAQFWGESCFMNYALAAPFIERLFVLGCDGAFMGQITANSFMKRQFGQNLIKKVLPKWLLTRVVDTSGAYIPGHGTPTVILFGRCTAPPTGDYSVWAVLGKRGEPTQPENPSIGFVWQAIVKSQDEKDDSNPYVTTIPIEHKFFLKHPWSLKGGKANELKSSVEKGNLPLSKKIAITGLSCITGEDSIFSDFPHTWRRHCAPQDLMYGFVLGEHLRDYCTNSDLRVLLPMTGLTGEVVSFGLLGGAQRLFWLAKPYLRKRIISGSTAMEDAGKAWFELRRLSQEKFTTPLTITFAFVSTHNHFVLDRGGKVFKRSAPVIKLPANATLKDHFDLLGLLNSSTLGFWMRQVFHNKGYSAAGGGGRMTAEPWDDFYEYDSTKLQKAPLTDQDRDERITLATALDATASERASCLPSAVLVTHFKATELATEMDTAQRQYRALTEKMVALQEELDWLTYHSYGFLDANIAVGPDDIVPVAPGHRPFEVVFARADEQADEVEKSAWWSRHGHDKVTEIPARYEGEARERMAQRIALIEKDEKIAHLEQAQFKRRWQTPDWDKEVKEAAESWLLDRLEDLFATEDTPNEHVPGEPHSELGSLSKPEPYRLEEIVAEWQADERVAEVAKLWADSSDVDLTLVAEQLLRAKAIPDNPRRVYSAEGLRKLDAWKKTWALQDLEDAGEPLVDPDTGKTLKKIPVPPKFKRGDFAQDDYYKLRGALNVPRERFILFADVMPQRYGWNGWRDVERAEAQTEVFTLAETDPMEPLERPTAEDPRRCGATIGLWESLPDVRRWGSAEDHAEFLALAEEACGQSSCPCALVERWEAWQRGDLRVERTTEAKDNGITVEERERVANQLILFGVDGAKFQELQQRWAGSTQRLQAVLDDLVASGDIEVVGRRGKHQRYALTQHGRG